MAERIRFQRSLLRGEGICRLALIEGRRQRMTLSAFDVIMAQRLPTQKTPPPNPSMIVTRTVSVNRNLLPLWKLFNGRLLSMISRICSLVAGHAATLQEFSYQMMILRDDPECNFLRSRALVFAASQLKTGFLGGR